MDEQVLIVGGGLTGLSTALRLPSHVRWSLFEKTRDPAVVFRTECRDGFTSTRPGTGCICVIRG